MITKMDVEDVLGCVLESKAFVRWWDTQIPRWGMMTPIEVWDAGNHERVLELVESYLDPSFS